MSGLKDPKTASKTARTTLANNLIAARKAVGLTQSKLGETRVSAEPTYTALRMNVRT